MGIAWAKRIQSPSDIHLAKEQGFDIVQMSVSEIMRLEDDAFLQERDRLLTEGIPCEVFESPLPEGVCATERGFNTYSWIEYLKIALARMASLGCKILLWGDPASRILPEEGEISVLKENFNQFLFMLADVAGKYGITVCLEPFSTRRTNFLNSFREVAGVIQSIGKENLAMTISSLDIVEIGAGINEIETYRELIAHAYIDSTENSGDLFQGLRRISFDNIISLPRGADAETLRICKVALAGA